jgi:hypothetical protein
MGDKLKTDLHDEFKFMLAQNSTVEGTTNKSLPTLSEEMAIDCEESCRDPGTPTDQETENENTCPRNRLNESQHAHTGPLSNRPPSDPKRWREEIAKTNNVQTIARSSPRKNLNH